MLQGIHQHISESCILLWQDFKFSKEACVARHMVTKQLFTPDREKLSKGLKKTFPGMSTLSNYIIKSIPLKWSPCEFVPLINWKIVPVCILVYITGNYNISILIVAIRIINTTLHITAYHYNLNLKVHGTLHFIQSHRSLDQPSAQEFTKYMGQPFPALASQPWRRRGRSDGKPNFFPANFPFSSLIPNPKPYTLTSWSWT